MDLQLKVCLRVAQPVQDLSGQSREIFAKVRSGRGRRAGAPAPALPGSVDQELATRDASRADAAGAMGRTSNVSRMTNQTTANVTSIMNDVAQSVSL